MFRAVCLCLLLSMSVHEATSSRTGLPRPVSSTSRNLILTRDKNVRRSEMSEAMTLMTLATLLNSLSTKFSVPMLFLALVMHGTYASLFANAL